jgi:hypothetical protein
VFLDDLPIAKFSVYHRIKLYAIGRRKLICLHKRLLDMMDEVIGQLRTARRAMLGRGSMSVQVAMIACCCVAVVW